MTTRCGNCNLTSCPGSTGARCKLLKSTAGSFPMIGPSVRVSKPFAVGKDDIRKTVEPNNAWERGIPTSRRPGGFEMPYLERDNKTPMHIKSFISKRSEFEKAISGKPIEGNS